MTIEIRPFLEGFPDREAALRAVLELDETAFGEDTQEEDISSPLFEVLDNDRTFVAWEGNQIVGTCANFTLTTSTPGGSLPSAGVTFIGVRPTHRRRGLMTDMLAMLHADGLARNEPIAVLWSADAALYGRFGYAPATHRVVLEVPHTHAELLNAPTDPTLRLRMVEANDDFELIAPVYESVERSRGGVPHLDEKWNRRHVYDPPHFREGASRVRTVVVEDDRGVRGYLRYGLKPEWPGGRYADGTLVLYRLMSKDAAAHAALWRYCLSIDLMTKTTWWNAPVDDPVLTWLVQSRQTTRQTTDGMWLRILDLPSALTGRTYTHDVDVTLRVTDSLFEANDGTWRLHGGPDGASCEPSSDAPDLTVDIRTLGAILLGGPTLLSHSEAGWVDEHVPGSVATTSTAFAAPLAPYCPFVF